MNKLKNIALIILLAIAIIPLSSCCCKKEAQKTTQVVDYVKEGYAALTVLFYELDGCKWMLVQEDGKKLNPDGGLAEAFQKDQTKVWVKYELLKNAPNICMAGTMVKVVDIKERK